MSVAARGVPPAAAPGAPADGAAAALARIAVLEAQLAVATSTGPIRVTAEELDNLELEMQRQYNEQLMAEVEVRAGARAGG
jgi:hypothetical protein